MAAAAEEEDAVDEGTGLTPSSGNGYDYGADSWGQNLQEVTVSIPVPAGTKAKTLAGRPRARSPGGSSGWGEAWAPGGGRRDERDAQRPGVGAAGRGAAGAEGPRAGGRPGAGAG